MCVPPFVRVWSWSAPILRSDRRHHSAAGYRDVGAGGEACQIGQQEGCHIGDLLIRAASAERYGLVIVGRLLGMLGTDESACADQAASIFNSCQDVVESALLMAAEAKKVSADLYAIIPEPGLTPLEQMADDGFREVEPDTPESEAEAVESKADESESEA